VPPFWCPLSVELLASAIRSDKSIKGLLLDSKEFKLSQYADDTTCLVEDTSSAGKLFEMVDLFRLCSGLELNRSKTEALWLGSNKNRTDTPFGICWPKDYVNALGICFTTDENISYSKTRLLSLENVLTCGLPEKKNVNKQIVEFIWSHKNPKIKKTTMIGEKKEGD